MADRSLLGVLVELFVSNNPKIYTMQLRKLLLAVLLLSFPLCEKCLSQYYGYQQQRYYQDQQQQYYQQQQRHYQQYQQQYYHQQQQQKLFQQEQQSQYHQQQQQYYQQLYEQKQRLARITEETTYRYWLNRQLDTHSPYHPNSPYNPNSPNYMFRYWGNAYENNGDDFTVSGINTISQSTKTPDVQKNDPDAKSGLFAPKNPNKACLVVMRPKNDWAIVDWDIKLNDKKYDSIEAHSSRVLEVPSGEYSMTCGSMGIGSCIKFKASPGSTHFITAEWERFAVLPPNEGEALYRDIKKNKDRASKLTPSQKLNSANQGAYSTR
jgi:hypothetical protein